jgi:hypothetical protein
MSVLRGRPPRKTAPAAKPEGRSTLPDDAKITIATRVTNAQHTRMKIVAAQNRISVEEAYRAAIDAYLRNF